MYVSFCCFQLCISSRKLGLFYRPIITACAGGGLLCPTTVCDHCILCFQRYWTCKAATGTLEPADYWRQASGALPPCEGGSENDLSHIPRVQTQLRSPNETRIGIEVLMLMVIHVQYKTITYSSKLWRALFQQAPNDRMIQVQSGRIAHDWFDKYLIRLRGPARARRRDEADS